MPQVTIIQEVNVAERIPISGTVSECAASIWLFYGDWDHHMEYGGGDWRLQATKLMGPAYGPLPEDLQKNLAAALRRLGFEVFEETTADD